MLSAVCALSLVVMAPAVPVPVETPKVEAPTEAPPAMAGVKLGKDGATLELVRAVSVTQAVPETVKVPVTVTVQKGNETVTETRFVDQVRYVTVQKTVMQTTKYALKDTMIQDLKGKTLTADEAKKKLGEGLNPVLILQAQPGDPQGRGQPGGLDQRCPTDGGQRRPGPGERSGCGG